MRSKQVLCCLATLILLASAASKADYDDDAACPPDSVLNEAGQCACAPERCHALASCRAGLESSLRRAASNKPGDCCDVVECVQKPEPDCSHVTCPKEADCPEDSYSLPIPHALRAPNVCCAVGHASFGCECYPPPCAAAACAPGEFAREVRAGRGTPGQCCPLYQCLPYGARSNATCAADDGAEVSDGATWRRDACNECVCADGVVTCSASPSCVPLPPGCVSSSLSEDGCCQRCDDPVGVAPGGCLTSRGDFHANGATWQEDACTSCVCAQGRRACQAYMCEWACAEPRYVAGECCPLCDPEDNHVTSGVGEIDAVLPTASCPPLNGSCALRCVHGFRRDEAGCFICQCQAEQCTLECPSTGFAVSAAGQGKLCACAAAAACPSLAACRKKCPHGFKLNRAGCETCRCRACPPLACDDACKHGFALERGCPTCRCRDTPDETTDLIGSLPEVGKEAGCLTTDGQLRAPGATWQDGCRRCLCHAGAALCSACAQCVDNNATFAAGESWNRDPNTRCTCDLDGTKSCTQLVGGSSSARRFLYELVIVVLVLSIASYVVYKAYRWYWRRRTNRMDVTKPYRAPETPPPQYASADRRQPHTYMNVSQFDAADGPPDYTPACPAPSRIV